MRLIIEIDRSPDDAFLANDIAQAFHVRYIQPVTMIATSGLMDVPLGHENRATGVVRRDYFRIEIDGGMALTAEQRALLHKHSHTVRIDLQELLSEQVDATHAEPITGESATIKVA